MALSFIGALIMNQWNKAEINAAITETGKTANEVNGNIHIILCQAIGHALVSSGDVTAFDRVLDVFRGNDRKAITRWIIDFAPVQFRNNTAKLTKTKYKDMQPNGKTPFVLDDFLDGTDWTEYLPEKREILAAFDLEKRAYSLLTQLEAKQEGGKPVANADFASYLKTALTGYHEFKAAQKIRPAEEEKLAA